MTVKIQEITENYHCSKCSKTPAPSLPSDVEYSKKPSVANFNLSIIAIANFLDIVY